MENQRNLENEVEAFGDMLEPLCIIAEDDEIKDAMKNKSILRAATIIAKKHPKETVEFILLYEGVSREESDLTRKNVLKKLIKILGDTEIITAFQSQEQKKGD